MSRGIHRFVVTTEGPIVKVRAQSASLRGQAFTVGSVRANLAGNSPEDVKAALRQAILDLYPGSAAASS